MGPHRPWRTCALALFLSLSLSSCRSTSDGSDAKFGWDEDLTPNKPGESKGSSGNTNRPIVDGSFCRGEEPGRCFSLVIRVPTSDFINDMGLSVLAMAGQSQAMARRLEEACQAAWLDYKQRYEDSKTAPVRRMFVAKVNKFRCIIVPVSEEYLLESVPLANQEVGLSVRLTKFDITGRNDSAVVGVLKLASDKTTVETQFRSASTFAGKDVRGEKGPWRPLTAFTVKPVSVQQSLGRSLSWQVDTGALLNALSSIDTSKIKDQADQAVKSFADKAKLILGQATANGVSPGSSLVLIGAGYEAYKALCGEDNSRCKVTSSAGSKLPDLKPDVVPTTDANEALRAALIGSIQSILDKVFELGDRTQIVSEFKLKS